jgi:hypothetical protein
MDEVSQRCKSRRESEDYDKLSNYVSISSRKMKYLSRFRNNKEIELRKKKEEKTQ